MKPGNDAVPSSPSLRHPGRWLWLILLVPVAIGLVRLRFDVEIFDLLPPNLAAVQGLKLYQRHFANARELLVTIKGADAEQTEAAALALATKLQSRTNLVASVTWEPPWLEHPEQAAELMAYLWLNQPPEAFRELTNRLAPDKLPKILATAREELATSMSPQEIARLSYDPYGLTLLPEGAEGAAPSFAQGQEMFSSGDGRFRLVFVQAARELTTYRECQSWLGQVRQSASNAVDALPGVSLGFTGRPAFMSEVAGGMEHDISTSVGGTAVIIAVLFWLAHRRIKPMLWLLALLTLILGSTLALGGLIFGSINVVSMGFAAILLGLAVDYAVVHYQEALAHPHLSIPQIRHAIAPSIFWAAVTTISAFLVLNFGGLPGLGQLGTLVGLGVALAATIMIFEFLPPLFPGRRETVPGISAPLAAKPSAGPLNRLTGFVITGAVLASVSLILAFGLPRVDPSANALRPRNSQAYAAIDEMQSQLNQKREPLWLLIAGRDLAEVEQKLLQAQAALARAVSNQLIDGFTLPTPLWPRPDYQAKNRSSALTLASESQAFREAAQTNGFAEGSLALTDQILSTWKNAAAVTGTFWPTNPMSRWIFDKFSAHAPEKEFALGLVNARQNGGARGEAMATLAAELPQGDVWLSGWELLGSSIFSEVKLNLWKVVVPMVLLVLFSLYLAFRRLPEILLSVAVLVLSGLVLLAVMRLFHWSWNLLNLMAIPLVLGTGVDYSIFMQLALRRFHGDQRMAYQSVGRALLLCGGTAIAGFGSLAWSSNAGMASLGQVCAVGVAGNMLIAIFLLPLWWETAGERGSKPEISPPENSAPASGPRPSGPSALYRSELWRLGQMLVRVLPRNVLAVCGFTLAGVYWRLAPHRRKVVVENLLPALHGERQAANAKAKALFRHFARKIVDLWRYEAGLPIEELFGVTSGWEHFERAQAEKRGVLLVTPHLGNWEFGGPSLSRRGVALQVVTLAEPGNELTAMRQASRARWKIETLVIRNDPFAFLEVIRRLEDGATVALLIDRPPPPTATIVELFGRPFPASIAAAELARASGCVVLPVCVPRSGDVYEAHILPPVQYDRAALRDRAARQQFTQELMRVFEPLIRQHLEQWYHFVPVWPPEAG